MLKPTSKIAVIGLGYVGLPLAIALASHFEVVGYDKDVNRIEELKRGIDRTREKARHAIDGSSANFTANAKDIAGADVFIITVPTPVDSSNSPDLSAVRSASQEIGSFLKRGAIVILESTVYPGVTEEVCGPEISKISGLECGVDFHLGYAPERINPGDHVHGLGNVVKVVAGQTDEVATVLADLYGKIVEAGVYIARDIRTAEAAKVIENAQRDINIAFVNEVAMISGRLGVSVNDVLEAAGTKWNFLPFKPGLVGGHCIGVDPYYLAYKSRKAGHEPEIILAGRRINDAMGGYLADRIDGLLGRASQILILGITFKENVPDLRNSKVVDLARELESRGHAIDIADPLADIDEARKLYGVNIRRKLDGAGGYDCVVGAVMHDAYRHMGGNDFAGLLKQGGLLADIKGGWRSLNMPNDLRYWEI